MLAVAIIVASIALADSVNPTTIGPAAFLAAGRRPRRQLIGFVGGVFGVSFIAGAIVVLGPGQLVLQHVHRPRPATVHALELGAGIVALVAAAGVWLTRERVSGAINRTRDRGRSGLALGAGIMAAELPTAFPYFAALAAIVASGLSLPVRVALLAVYNAVFVAPLLALLAAIVVGGERADILLRGVDRWLREHVASLTAGLLAAAGLGLSALGAVELLS